MPQFPLTRYRLSTSDYHRMIEAGILTERDRVELIDGEIIQMSPKGSKHAACVSKITEWLLPLVAGEAQMRTQDPIRIPDLSEPEPDLVLVKNREDFYATAHPAPADIFLVVEVADSSLAYDREIKGPLYAKAGIPAYWIIDLQGQQIEVFAEPSDSTYSRHHLARPGEQIMIPPLNLKTRVEDWLI
ncbi:MAG: Uma2 family endonuclease [Bacteroidia bacterium]|nr:Uma2 family endonuclease [Bacteroidia bacterium]